MICSYNLEPLAFPESKQDFGAEFLWWNITMRILSQLIPLRNTDTAYSFLPIETNNWLSGHTIHAILQVYTRLI